MCFNCRKFINYIHFFCFIYTFFVILCDVQIYINSIKKSFKEISACINSVNACLYMLHLKKKKK